MAGIGKRVDGMLQDLIYATRTLRSSRVFTATAVITLALGIGASTAIFSVANAVLLRPLPYKDSGRLVYACSDMPKRNVYDHFWSDADYFDLRNHASDALEDVAAVRTGRGNFVHDDGTPDEVAYAAVTPNLFRMLGVRVVLGRDFIDSDGEPQPPAADGGLPPPDQRLPTYAIVSQAYFQRRFGGNPAALGQPIVKNGPILVGVLERGAELFFRPDKNIEQKPDLWTAGRLNYNVPRTGLAWHLIARLRNGVTLRRAQEQTDAVAEQIRALDPVIRGTGFAIRLEPMRAYLVSQVRPAILALMGAAKIGRAS